MHDPQTVAHEIKYPWFKYKPWPKKYRNSATKRDAFAKMKADGIIGRDPFCEEGYRETFITIWHIDPETDHTDDSCGWFMRPRHCNQQTLQRIVKRFEEDWDRVFISKPDPGDEPRSERTYCCGYFYPENEGAGMPNMSVTAIVLNLFFLAACEHFKTDGLTMWRPARDYMRKRLFDIMLFAENPTDSLLDEVVRKWGTSTNREDRILNMAGIIYSWICRDTRPWWKHPRWHIHHWRLDCHPLRQLKRWAFSRCCKCGKRFPLGYAPVSNNWHSTDPLWFKGETDVYHSDCNHVSVAESQCGSVEPKNS